LFFVGNTCGNGGDYPGLIYVEGSRTFTHCVFVNNNIDNGAAIGFGSGSYGSVTLSNWLIDEQLTTSGNGQVNVPDAGTAQLSGATPPATCPFTIAAPTASRSQNFVSSIGFNRLPALTQPKLFAPSGNFLRLPTSSRP
jgi:hypothetical protein